MFPTAGYFRGVECPFFKEGSCYRPYCHYKHAKLKAQRPKQPTRPPNTSSLLIKRLEAAKHKNSEQKSANNLESSHQLESTTKPTTPPKSEAATTALPNKTAKPAPCGDDTDRTSSGTLEQQQHVSEHVDAHPATNLPSDPTSSQSTDITMDDIPSSATSDESKLQHGVVKHSITDDVKVSSKQKVEVTSSPQKFRIGTTTDSHRDTLYEKKLGNQELPSTTHTTKPQDVRTVPSVIPDDDDDDKPRDYQEPVYDDSMSYDTTDDSSQVFDELFGSSGGEDDYDDISGDMELVGSEMEQRRTEEEFRRITAQSIELPHVPAVKLSYENIGMKNKRQAHGNAELMRHGVTAGRPKIKTTSTGNPVLNDPTSIYAGKKRKAHHLSDTSSVDVTVAAPPPPKRPRLLVSVNARIPTAVRQNFLDSFIDEYLKFLSEEKAYKKGMEDEQSLFKKANNKMLYMNLSSIALKRLREQASKEQVISRPPHVTKKSSTTHSMKRSSETTSPTAASNVMVHAAKERTKVKTYETKPPVGTYYLDEIFKTSVNMETHQKSNPHSSDDHKNLSLDTISPSGDDNPNKSTASKTSFDSALQKIDRKMMAKKSKLKQSSTLRKQQGIRLTVGHSSNTVSHSDDLPHEKAIDTTGTSDNTVKTKPTSLHVQKLIDKGYAKVKSKGDNHVSTTHPTNRISLASKHLFKSVTPSGTAVKQKSISDKAKIVRQISVSPKLSSAPSTTESPSSKVASGPMMTSSQFYGSQSQVSTKNKTGVKQAPAPSLSKPRTITLPNYSILKKKEVVLTDEIFVQYMHSYLLTEEQLVENGYPRPTSDPGVASIMRKPDDNSSDIKPVGPNAQRHTCCRCGKPFIIYNSGSYQSIEDCFYHTKRLQKKREYGEGVISYYPCCQGNRGSSGCQIAKMHVTKGEKPPLESGYVQTGKHPGERNYTPCVYALDCEMCYTTAGLELTRVSVVGTNNESVYEKLVKPDYPIVDYNTKFSGLTAQDFIAVTTRLQDVQQDLLNLFYEDTILLGHSLESDLLSLKIIHSRVVDTAIVFPHRLGLPYKRALRTITAEFIHKIIQDEVDGGHDSKEDAVSCMELMKWKIKSDLQKTTRRGSVT